MENIILWEKGYAWSVGNKSGAEKIYGMKGGLDWEKPSQKWPLAIFNCREAAQDYADYLLSTGRVTVAEVFPILISFDVLGVEPLTFDIPDVEIFRAGVWTDSAGRTVAYTAEDIERMAAAHCELGGNFEAPVKLGHDPEQPITDGLPALGWLRNIRAEGGRLIADLTGVPKKVHDLIRAGAYKKRNLQVLHNFRDEATGRIYPHVAAGLALLGARLPAIGSLSDIRSLYETNGGGAAYLYEAGPSGIIGRHGAGAERVCIENR